MPGKFRVGRLQSSRDGLNRFRRERSLHIYPIFGGDREALEVRVDFEDSRNFAFFETTSLSRYEETVL
jgi:hypothetical protein